MSSTLGRKLNLSMWILAKCRPRTLGGFNPVERYARKSCCNTFNVISFQIFPTAVSVLTTQFISVNIHSSISTWFDYKIIMMPHFSVFSLDYGFLPFSYNLNPISIHKVDLILWHVHPLLGNEWQTHFHRDGFLETNLLWNTLPGIWKCPVSRSVLGITSPLPNMHQELFPCGKVPNAWSCPLSSL